MEPSDAELVRRWQEGDALCFEALVRRWQGRVARLLARLAGPESVPDLCQEVFLRVYQAGPRYREEGVFSTWIYRIALNLARDNGRRKWRPAARIEDHEPLDPATPADRVTREEGVRLLTRALGELPEAMREVLVLRHYEGLNFEQIARLTGTPASTLKSRFAAGLARLRVRLEQLGWTPGEDTP